MGVFLFRQDGDSTKVEDLSAGDHKLVFTATGYRPKIVRFKAKKGEKKKVTVRLEKDDGRTAKNDVSDKKPDKKPKPTTTTKPPPPPEPVTPPVDAGPPGTVNVNSRGGFCSNVIIGGRSVGPTPVAGVSVKPGPVSILCKLADGRTIGSGAMVKSGQVARVTITIPK